jgi:hypothetical protein
MKDELFLDKYQNKKIIIYIQFKIINTHFLIFIHFIDCWKIFLNFKTFFKII